MSYLFEHERQRREVEELHRLAMDAYREGQYATSERLLEQAAVTAERLDDLPLLIKERYWLASARRLQGKLGQTLSIYTWLIGLASDPTHSQQIRDANSLWYLAGAFTDFVESGFNMALPVEQLLRVIADGLDWIERVGKANWAASLHLERSELFEAQQRWQEARQEMEVSLALRRRHSEAPGYTLAAHLLGLADLLCEEGVGAYAEAIPLAEEVLAAPGTNIDDRQRAYKTLAYAHLRLHEYEAALQAAQQSLTLAHSIQSSSGISIAYEVLGKLYRATGRLRDAGSAGAHRWTWSRKQGKIQRSYLTLKDCAEVRLLQVREACSLPLDAEELPDHVPATANRKLALRRLASTHRFVGLARPFASQLDQASGSHSSQNELDDLEQQIALLVGLLEKEELH